MEEVLFSHLAFPWTYLEILKKSLRNLEGFLLSLYFGD